MIEEFLDLYDINKKKLNVKHNRADPLPDSCYRLIALSWVMDKKGEFLITRRSFEKDYYPGLWEVPGGGAVASETSFEAAIRELKEETGLLANIEDAVLFGSVINDEKIFDYWLFKQEFDISALRLDANETIDARKASWEEIETLMNNGDFFNEPLEIREYLSKASRVFKN